MYLENMSDQEILAQFKKDFDEVKAKYSNHVINVTRRKAIEANRFPFADGYHCKMDNGNDYYVVSVFTNKYNLKKGNVASIIGSIIDTERGKMFIQITYDEINNKHVCWYTAHYFRRYAERMGMDKDAPMKNIIKTFFTRNPEQCQEYKFTEKDGENRIMACFRDGVAMARIKNGKQVMMTFLPNDLLNRQQSKRRDILEEFRQEFAEELKRNGEFL